MVRRPHSPVRREKECLYYYHDGLLDILFGAILLLFGLGILAEMPWLGFAFFALLLIGWPFLKRWLTAPRLNHRDLEEIQRFAGGFRGGLVAGGVALLAVLVLALFLLWAQWAEVFTPKTEIWLRAWSELVFGLAGALLAGLIAVFTNETQYKFYALLTALIFIFDYLAHIPLSISLVLVGGVMLIGGGYGLARFLWAHPVLVRHSSST